MLERRWVRYGTLFLSRSLLINNNKKELFLSTTVTYRVTLRLRACSLAQPAVTKMKEQIKIQNE